MSIFRVNKVQSVDGSEIFDGTSGRMVLPAGTETNPPIKFTAASSTNSIIPGAIEYNGRSFYTTPDAFSGKAFNDEGHFYALDADTVIVPTIVANTEYPIFGVGLTVAPDSAYLVDIVVGLRTGATSHNIGFNFGGTASYSDCQYRTEFTNLALSTGTSAPGTPTAATTLMFVSNPIVRANSIISPASTLVSKFFRVHGIITTSSGGTIVPQISFSANPTGSNQVTRLSYVKLNPIGTSQGVLQAGNWS